MNLLKPFIIIISIYLISHSLLGQTCSSFTDADWRIGSTWDSHKISPCHTSAVYNCHGFVLSYLEDGCQPSYFTTQSPPYTCPNDQGILGTGEITNNPKFMKVCTEAQADAIVYNSSAGPHSAVKVSAGSGYKYISKYGSDGPLVSHNRDGSYYHYTQAATFASYHAYIGTIQGSTSVTGTSNVTYSVNNKSGVTYSWSIISGGIYASIQGSSSGSSVTIKPKLSGNVTLKLTTSSSCDINRTQTINLSINTNVCLEGSYTNAGSNPFFLNTSNSVGTGSVSTDVNCTGASSYTWQRTSGTLSYYANGDDLSFTMTSGASVSFLVTAKSGSTTLATRTISFYNFGSLMVYPNPGSGFLDIDVVEGVELDITMTNEKQQLAKEIKSYTAGSKADLSELAPGKYYISIYHKGEKLKDHILIIEK